MQQPDILKNRKNSIHASVKSKSVTVFKKLSNHKIKKSQSVN